MIDPNSIQIAAEAIKELGLAQLAPTVYQEVLQPAARETGKNLLVVAKAVGIAISPLKATVWGYEQVSDYLKAQITAKLAHKPASEIKSPDPVVAGPLIMGMAFASEAPHLREMYANLLASAMHTPSASKAHPSFVNAIQQLSPSEARLLQIIATTSPHFVIASDEILGGPNSVQSISSVTIEAPFRDSWRHFCASVEIADSTLADTYRDNLLRLGILSYRYDVARDVLAGISGLKAARALTLTDYGKLFLKICVLGI
jgi:hypothetical protein